MTHVSFFILTTDNIVVGSFVNYMCALLYAVEDEKGKATLRYWVSLVLMFETLPFFGIVHK